MRPFAPRFILLVTAFFLVHVPICNSLNEVHEKISKLVIDEIHHKQSAQASSLQNNERHSIRVYIKLTDSFSINDASKQDELLDRFQSNGATVYGKVWEWRTVDARIPLDSIEDIILWAEIEMLSWPEFVDSTIPPIIDAPNVSKKNSQSQKKYSKQDLGAEGEQPLDSAHIIGLEGNIEFDGEGIKIGFIGPGIKGYQTSVESGDLPVGWGPDEYAMQFGEADQFGNSEGTAIMEIMHDIAPKAELYHAKIDTTVTYMEAIDWLSTTKRVDLIGSDVAFIFDPSSALSGNENYFHNQGNDRLAKRIQQLVEEQHIPFFKSAGNQAYRHYAARFDPDNLRYHKTKTLEDGSFYNFLKLTVQPDSKVNLDLVWDEEFGNSPNTSLYRLGFHIGVGDHDEWLAFINGENADYIIEDSTSTEMVEYELIDLPFQPIKRWRIQTSDELVEDVDVYLFFKKKSSHTPNIKFELYVRPVEGNAFLDQSFPVSPIATSSITGPGDAVGAYSVGAAHGQYIPGTTTFISWRDEPQPDDPNLLLLAPYSSHGPTNDGRIRPHIIAPANINTYVGNVVEEKQKFYPFYGTSAAVPHVVAAAALLLDAASPMHPQEIYYALNESAIAMDAYGEEFNNQSGFGFLNIPNAIVSAEDHAGTIDDVTMELGDLTVRGHAREVEDENLEFVGPLWITDSLRINPIELAGPVLHQTGQTQPFFQGNGQLYFLNARNIGDLLFQSGLFRLNHDGTISPGSNPDNPLGQLNIADLRIDYATAQIKFFEGDFDPLNPPNSIPQSFSYWRLASNHNQSEFLTFYNANSNLGPLPINIPSLSLAEDGLFLDELKFSAGGLQLSAQGVGYSYSQFNADKLTANLGGLGAVDFNNLVIRTDINEMTFDSGAAYAVGALVNMQDGFINSEGDIAVGGGTISGLEPIGVEPIVIPPFEFIDGRLSVFGEVSCSMLGFNVVSLDELSFGGNQGLYIENGAITLHDKAELLANDLFVSKEPHVFRADAGVLYIEDTAEIELEPIEFSPEIISIAGGVATFSVPGLPEDPINLPGFEIIDGVVTTLDPIAINLPGFGAEFASGFTIGRDAGVSIPGATLFVAGGASLILNDFVADGSGGFTSEYGSVAIAQVAAIEMTGVSIGNEEISATSATAYVNAPGFPEDGFQIPGFIINRNKVSIDFSSLSEPFELQIASLNTQLSDTFSISKTEGVTIDGATVSVLNRYALAVEGLTVDERNFTASSAFLTMPPLLTFSSNQMNVSTSSGQETIVLEDGELLFMTPGFPEEPIAVERFEIGPEQIDIQLPESVGINIGGIEFTVMGITVERPAGSTDGDPGIVFHNLEATIDPNNADNPLFTINIDRLLVSNGQIKIEGGAGAQIRNVGELTLTEPILEPGLFAFETATLQISNLLVVDFENLVIDKDNKSLNFSSGIISIADIFDADFGVTTIDGDMVIIEEGVAIDIANAEGLVSAERIAIGPGQLVAVENGGFKLAGFEFGFDFDLNPGESFLMAIRMKFPQNKLPWPEVEGGIGLVRSGGRSKVASFTLAVRGGKIPGTDLGIENLAVTFDEDGAPGGGALFAGAGEFSIPSMFTVGLGAELYGNCLNSFHVSVRDMNIAMGPSGVYFQDIFFGASGFCPPYNNPAGVEAIMTKWDAFFDGSTLTTDPSELPAQSFADLLTAQSLNGGIILPVNVSVKDLPSNLLPVVGNSASSQQQAVYRVKPSQAGNGVGVFQSCEVEMEVPGTDRVITFEIEIALTAGPRINGFDFAELTANGKFDTTGWMLIRGDLTILQLPVSNTEFELNPSGPNCGVRLEMSVNLLDVLRGAAGVRIDCSKNVSGYIEASISVPENVKIIGGFELAAVEAFFSKQKISGEVRILKLPFGFKIEDRKFSIGRNAAPPEYESDITPYLFDEGYRVFSHRSKETHEMKILTNWKKAYGEIQPKRSKLSAPQRVVSTPDFTLNKDVDSLIVVIQGGVLPLRGSLRAPNGITYTSDIDNDANVVELDPATSLSTYASLSDDVAFVSIQDWGSNRDPGLPTNPVINMQPSSLSFMLTNPPQGDYSVILDSFDADRDVSIEFLLPDEKPSIQLGAPFIHGNGTVSMSYIANDPDSNAEIEFYLDSDFEGGDGILVGTAVEQDGNGALVFDPNNLPSNSESDEIVMSATDWNQDGVVTAEDADIALKHEIVLDSYVRPETVSVPSGRYFISARIDDDANAPVVVYGDPVTIVNQHAPSAPSNVEVFSSSSSVIMTWTGSTDSDGDLVGYKVLYSDDLNAIHFDQSIGVDTRNNSADGKRHSVVVPDLINGHPYRFAVVAYDSARNDSLYSEVVIGAPLSPDGFNAPFFTSQPETIAKVGSPYRYLATVRDLDLSQQRTFELLHGPQDMAIDSANGLLLYQPSMETVGSTTVSIQVTDASDLSAIQTFHLRTLAPIEEIPAKDQICSFPPKTAYVGAPYSYQVDYSCSRPISVIGPLPGGGASPYEITYRLIEAPAGMLIDDDGLVSWTPLYEQVGSHLVVIELAINDSQTDDPPVRTSQSYYVYVQTLDDVIPDPGFIFSPPTPTPTPTPAPTPAPPLPGDVIVSDVKFFERDGSSGIDPETFALHSNETVISLISKRMNRFASFSIDADSMALTPKSLITQGINSPVDAVFAEKSSLLFVSNAEGLLYTARVNEASGELVPLKQISFGLFDADVADQMVVSNDEQFVYISAKNQGRIFAYRLSPSDGSMEFSRLTNLDTSVVGNASIRRMVFSPDGTRLYVLLNEPNLVIVYSVNQSNGLLSVIQYFSLDRLSAIDLVVSSLGQYACILQSNGNLDLLSIDQDGKLNQRGSTNFRETVSAVKLIWEPKANLLVRISTDRFDFFQIAGNSLQLLQKVAGASIHPQFVSIDHADIGNKGLLIAMSRFEDGSENTRIASVILSKLLERLGSAPSVTPTPISPQPTPTPSGPRPTSIPIPLLAENVSIGEVNGFSLSTDVQFGDVPTDNAFEGATDGDGMTITLNPGEGVFMPVLPGVNWQEPLVDMSLSIRASNDSVQAALIALVVPIDGSFAFVNPVGPEIPVNKWGKMRLVYNSPTQQILPVIQFVVPDTDGAQKSVVHIDSLRINPFNDSQSNGLSLSIDSEFENIGDGSALNVNSFLPPGSIAGSVFVGPGFEGDGVRLVINPDEVAAHIAPFAQAPSYPAFLQQQVMVQRMEDDDGLGTLGLYMTDGGQNVGYFFKTAQLPIGEFTPWTIGSLFNSPTKPFAPIIFVQLGGPNVSGDILIDDLFVHQSQ
jgi:hypothetical protein